MSAERRVAILPFLDPSQFHMLGAGEVVFGEYNGDPLVSVYDPVTRQGGAVRFDRQEMEGEFVRFIKAFKAEVKETDVARLQIKFLVSHSDEKRVKQLCILAGIQPQAIAGFDDKGRLEVFFYSDTGRLRVAPVADNFRETSKEVNAAQAAVKKKMKVLVVDDSKTMRTFLRRIIDQSAELEVVAEAELPSQVEDLIAAYNPDVMTLDINMPEMSGVDLLRKILSYRFIPTVMISALSIDDGRDVISALELGAVDYIQKPGSGDMTPTVPVIQEKILNAARVKHVPNRDALALQRKPSAAGPKRIIREFKNPGLIAIGASTGGTEAIKQLFMNFPRNVPPILVVQHIPPYFSTAFTKRLNELANFEVKEAEDGDEIIPGRALVAPGGLHLEVAKEGDRLIARVFDGELVNRFKPSVDVLFSSIARHVGSSATGVLLTGMGRDGAQGLLEMKNSGALTIAQSEDSCVVYGMPRVAVEIGAATMVQSLEDIPFALMKGKVAA